MAQDQRPSPASQYEMFQNPRSEYGQVYHPQPRPGFGFNPPGRGEQFGPQPTNFVYRGSFYEPTWDRNERLLPFGPPVGAPTYSSREPNHGSRAPSHEPSYGHDIPMHPGQVYANRPTLSAPPRPWPTERHMYREYHDQGPGPFSSEYGYQGRNGPPIGGHANHDGYQPGLNGLAHPHNPNEYGNWGNAPPWWQEGMGRR
ncbi:hypothetical protein E8E13_010681 [Curvularia kusanoi]|uniref:Uncharacterized protein n=1 Tax=Curvularia kusanoi TaxID=90978 RepID=A0A9P4THE1_CURKU|nr:hypothetical protein E8E13_010681 [Curvularia kusanoi]